MKTVFELDEKDIQVLLADKFLCDPTDVLISVTKECEGVGPTEHLVSKVKVIIKKEERLC